MRPDSMHSARLLLLLPFLYAADIFGAGVEVTAFRVPRGAHPHDVAPAPDGSVWYTAQMQGALGRLDPATGETKQIPLGDGSAPHGVIVGPDNAPWITDGGLNAVVRVDPKTFDVKRFPLPESAPSANLNTAAFDHSGRLWFTGQSGIYGVLNPGTGEIKVYPAPRGAGPYGITSTPKGEIFYASLAGSYIARIDTATGQATVIDPPTPRAGARRLWSDSRGRIWVSEFFAGQLAVYDPAADQWQAWHLPFKGAQTYALYVDQRDLVWMSDFGSNSIVKFNPKTQSFEAFPSPRPGARVRQLLGRANAVWGAESGTDYLVRFVIN